MLNNENKFHEKLDVYYGSLPMYLREDCLRAFKSLREKGRTYEWIYTAVSKKEIAHWEERGFGLLFSEDYQSEIDKALEEKAARAAKILESTKGWEEKPSEVVYWTPQPASEWKKDWEKRMTKKKKLWDIH